MSKKFESRELSIVLAARNHNPTILNPDFLKYNDIVPSSWKVKEPPICIEPMAQVVYDNGVKITAELDKIIFLEPIIDIENVGSIKIFEMANKYIETLPHVQYNAIGINPKVHIIFDTVDNAKNFIFDTFIKSDVWKKFDDKLINAGVKLSYKFDQVTLNLSVDASMLKISDNEHIPVALFSANFHHAISGETKKEQLENSSKIIGNWQSDIDILKDFLGKLSL